MTWSVSRGRGSIGTGRDLGFSSAVLTDAGVEKAVVPDVIIVVLGVVRRDILIKISIFKHYIFSA